MIYIIQRSQKITRMLWRCYLGLKFTNDGTLIWQITKYSDCDYHVSEKIKKSSSPFTTNKYCRSHRTQLTYYGRRLNIGHWHVYSWQGYVDLGTIMYDRELMWKPDTTVFIWTLADTIWRWICIIWTILCIIAILICRSWYW